MASKYYYTQLYQITLDGLCFGLLSGRYFGCRTQVIVEAAPVAKWSIGGKEQKILDYYKARGAKIKKIY